ncbi:NADPH-dependent FMN reductase [Gottfriedia sp. NPDC057948]|uniref:NADPH-dependent FMN reductase n=1 Tax=Gottfriedia sp. NPDC057948 TaxID=3346287 RepID=UPI0036D97489
MNEYNHSNSEVLKKAIDCFSRVDQVIVKKPVMIVEVSPGVLGTARAQMPLQPANGCYNW